MKKFDCIKFIDNVANMDNAQDYLMIMVSIAPELNEVVNSKNPNDLDGNPYYSLMADTLSISDPRFLQAFNDAIIGEDDLTMVGSVKEALQRLVLKHADKFAKTRLNKGFITLYGNGENAFICQLVDHGKNPDSWRPFEPRLLGYLYHDERTEAILFNVMDVNTFLLHEDVDSIIDEYLDILDKELYEANNAKMLTCNDDGSLTITCCESNDDDGDDTPHGTLS